MFRRFFDHPTLLAKIPRFLHRHRLALRHVILASFVINVLAIVLPIAMMLVFNKAIPHNAIATLNALGLAALMAVIFDYLLRSARSALVLTLGTRLQHQLERAVIGSLFAAPLRFFETTPAGKLREQLRQLDTIRTVATGQLPLVLLELPFSVLMIIVLTVIDWRFGLLAAIAAPALALLPRLSDDRQMRHSQRAFAAQSAKGSLFYEALNNSTSIKSLGLESALLHQYQRHSRHALWQSFRAQIIQSFHHNIAQLILTGVGFLLLYIGAWLVMTDGVSIGALIAANMLFIRALNPFRALLTAWSSLREAERAVSRLDDLLAIVPPQPSTLVAQLSSAKLTAEQISFSYISVPRPVFEGVNLTLAPGTITGLIGVAGSGKTTLAKVMAGLYQPANGEVRVGDTSVIRLDPRLRRLTVIYLGAQPQLFSLSIRDNILMAVPGAPPERAVHAAKFVGAHAFIQSLPRGYDTHLGEAEARLSDGQKQLIALARTVAAQPKTIILDEATCHLDQASEDQVMRALKSVLSSGLAVLIITHRKMLLRHCHRVLRLADGRIENVKPAPSRALTSDAA